MLQGLLSAYPNLKGIISPTTVGISTAAQYLSTHPELDGKVTLTGLGLPSQMKPYVQDGTVKAFELWNPNDLGYLAGYAAAALASGDVTTLDDRCDVQRPASSAATRSWRRPATPDPRWCSDRPPSSTSRTSTQFNF